MARGVSERLIAPLRRTASRILRLAGFEIHRTRTEVEVVEKRAGWTSYSQSGEDLIIAWIFRVIGVRRPRYLDLGSHHPIELNNTYFFYRRGARGTCVDPNPAFASEYRRLRHEDRFLNCAVAADAFEGEVKFHVFDPDTLSTVSEEAARSRQQEGHRLVRTLDIPVRSVRQILETHHEDGLDLLSLDVEGLDTEILRQWPFDRWTPAVICAETRSYSRTLRSDEKAESEIGEIDEILAERGYARLANTYVNSIYCRLEERGVR